MSLESPLGGRSTIAMLNDGFTARERTTRFSVAYTLGIHVSVVILLYQLLWFPIPAFCVFGSILYGCYVGATIAKSLRATGFFGVPFWKILTPFLTGSLTTFVISVNQISTDMSSMGADPGISASYVYRQATAWAVMSGILGSIIGAVIVGVAAMVRAFQQRTKWRKLG